MLSVKGNRPYPFEIVIAINYDANDRVAISLQLLDFRRTS
jgi:hypothetical protein